MTIECSNCETEYDRDPALEVACPQCKADVGQRCRRPSGHTCSIHVGRDKKALREIDWYERCSGVPEEDIESRDEEDQTKQTRIISTAGGEVSG